VGMIHREESSRRMHCLPLHTDATLHVSVSEMIRLGAGQPGFNSWQWQKSLSSRPRLGPSQAPIKWVHGAIFPGIKRTENKSDHYLYLMQKLAMCAVNLDGRTSYDGGHAVSSWLRHYATSRKVADSMRWIL
jgi:hypothetical protein